MERGKDSSKAKGKGIEENDCQPDLERMISKKIKQQKTKVYFKRGRLIIYIADTLL
jgi:hypothetical protein